MVESFGPIGDLQLHSLDAPANFTCAICRQHHRDDLAATVKGSWRLTVCHGCYLTLTNDWTRKQQHKKAKKKQAKARAKRDAAAGARTVPKQRTAAPQPVNTALNPRVSANVPNQTGMPRVLQFFWAAGLLIRQELADEFHGFPQPETDAWRRTVDRIAWEHAYGVLAQAVANNARYGRNLEAVPLPQEHGFAIMRGSETIVVIHPTHASVPRQPPLVGNFLAPGPHWAKVARVLEGDDDAMGTVVEPSEPVEPYESTIKPSAVYPQATPWRQINKLPDDLAPALADACVSASRRIRLERQLDYPCPVILRSRGITLTLEPVSGEDENRHVPFRLRTGTQSTDGKFLLRQYGPDPLPLLISASVAENEAITAWTCALVGFADVTCFELPPASPASRSVTGARSPVSVPLPRTAPEPRHLPRRSRWPRHLKPEGYWAREGSWVVAAHPRHLPEGQTASADALERARQAAIVLDPEQTWVKAHFCGRAHVAEVRFRWEPTAGIWH